MTEASCFSSHKNRPTDYLRAKRLRRDPTDGERILWHELRMATKVSGVRFRRQHPICPYVVDFACLNLRLIIEVDGTSHDNRMDKDRERDRRLSEMGYRVLRFTNEQVVENREGVVAVILNRVEKILNGNHQPLP